MAHLKRFLKSDEAATAVEYAVMLALIIIAALAGIQGFGNTTNDKFGTISTEMSDHGI